MKINKLIFTITIVSVFIFSTNYSFASKRNFITELYVFKKTNNSENLNNRSKQKIKISSKKPKPKKFRSILEYEFNQKFLSQVDIPYFIKILPEKIRGNNKNTENFDLDQNGKVDLVISYADPVTAFLDLNENGIHEIEYLFNGAERWIYFDENEDGNVDFLFKDLDGDGIDEEVIKIEN